MYLNARKRLGGPQIYVGEYLPLDPGEYPGQRPGPKDGLQDAQDGSNMGMQREVSGLQSILCSFFQHADRIFSISRGPGTPKSLKNRSKTQVFLIFSHVCRKPKKGRFWTGFWPPNPGKLTQKRVPGQPWDLKMAPNPIPVAPRCVPRAPR